MTYFKATIEILLAANSEAEACDAIVETLHPTLRAFSPGSPVIDWRYVGPGGDPEPHDGSGFEYAELGAAHARDDGGVCVPIE